MRSLIVAKVQIKNQLACKVGCILDGLLLGITHVAVCLVVVLLHLVSLIVAKQGKLLIYLVEGFIYSLCCSGDGLLVA